MERLAEDTETVIAAERVASADEVTTEASLAQRLVAAQLAIAERKYERGAIACLDLVERHPESVAGRQAAYFLGLALMHLDMERWAVEQFSQNLRDGSSEGQRFHQRSVARLLDLAVPRREQGFARRPSFSATPELRARLEAVGGVAETEPLVGFVSRADAEKLERWVLSFPSDQRSPELRYAYGRYLYLVGRHHDAQLELDTLNPLDIPMTRGGRDAQWRLRSAYIAAASSAAAGDLDDAMLRFLLVTQARPRASEDRQVVELARLAVARIHHDRGDYPQAIAAYRGLGRDSPFFLEALYESAWALLAARQYPQAIDALNDLVTYDPASPLDLEIKQLRGKVKIQARDYPGAESEFLALQKSFEGAVRQLAPRLQHRADATEYFASVVASELEHFSLTAVLPIEAVAVARTLPVAQSAVALARDTGALARELVEVRALLAQMEAALATSEKARLFNDLGAQAAALDHVELDLLEVREQLVRRLVAANGRLDSRSEAERKGLRRRVNEPSPRDGMTRARVAAWLERLKFELNALDRETIAARGVLVALERRFAEEVAALGEEAQRTFFTEAQGMRTSLRTHTSAQEALQHEVRRLQIRLRFDDPQRAAGRDARQAYARALGEMFRDEFKRSPSPDLVTVWRRADELALRTEQARVALETCATGRLEAAQRILEEERANLDAYGSQMDDVRDAVQRTVGEVLTATFRDVAVELHNLVVRSEVGLLDVAWALKEAEAAEATRLEKARNVDLRELDRSLQMGLEDASP